MATDSRRSLSFLLLIVCGLLMSGSAVAWIDGTPYFYERFPSWTAPDSSYHAPLQPQAPRFQIGDSRTFYAIDFREETQYTVMATLRSVGQFCYIFVENDQWQRRVSAVDVEEIRRAFDEQTPAGRNRGIYQIETEVLGWPPDIDGDPRILILLLDVRDRFTLGGEFIAGYFSPVNQQIGTVRDPNFGVPFRSNETEMIYLDVDPLDPGSSQGLSVLAHEFQHLIHWRYDTNEEIWVNEGCSDYATFLCGYDVTEHVKAFERSPEVSLTNWNTGIFNQLPHYGAAFLWMLYLHEQYGGERTIGTIIQEPRNGIAGISAALSTRGATSNFAQIFSDWRVANYVDDPSLGDGRYGYVHEDLNPVIRQTHRTYPVSRTTGQVRAFGGDAILFTNGIGGNNLILDLVEPLARIPLDVRIVYFQQGEPVWVSSLPLSDTGHGYLSVDGFGQQVQEVLVLPSFVPSDPGEMATVARFEYQARLGDKVHFRVNVLNNPVQPRYWELVARATHRIGAERPLVTITEGSVTRLEEQPMAVIQDGLLFGYSVYVSPGRDPTQIRWRVVYLGATIGEGTFGSELAE